MARQRATLNDLIDEYAEEEQHGLLDVYITPPDGDNSDADSGPEDDEDGPRTLKNLPRSILRAEAEGIDYSRAEEEEPPQEAQGSKKKKGRSWVQGDIESKLNDFDMTEAAENYIFQGLNLRDMEQAAALFLFDAEVLLKIREFSLKNARRKNDFAFDVSLDELKVFMSIIVLSGYIKVYI